MKKRVLIISITIALIISLAAAIVLLMPPKAPSAGNATENSAAIKEKVDELLDCKHKLTYNEDGSFRVMILADLHMTLKANAANQKLIRDHIQLLVDREQPNLVILTGDNTIFAYSEEDLRLCLDNVVGYLEEKQIPWCHVWGNHDEEHGMPRAKQQRIYQSYDYCVSKSGPEELTGDGNYALGVYKADGALGSVIYCLDSGMYTDTSKTIYDYIREDQIAWYKETSELLQKYNGGQVVPGMMAFHIPLFESNKIYYYREDPEVVTEWDGAVNSAISSSYMDTDLLETVLDRGDVKAIVTGHDHNNTYTLNYKGAVKLAACPTVSPNSLALGGTEDIWGVRILDLNTETVGSNIPTYISYVVEKDRE